MVSAEHEALLEVLRREPAVMRPLLERVLGGVQEIAVVEAASE